MKIKAIFLIFFVLIFLSALLLFPSESSEGVKNGLNYSATLLIPSLFPFMVLSSFAIRSGFSEIAGKLFSKITKFLFGLPSVCSATIILSLVGGFPVGAKCIRLLYDEKKISLVQAQRMMLFCVCSGPAFLITAIGAIMLKNITAGIILYISQIVSCIILGIVSRFIYRKENTKLISSEVKSKPKINILSAFIMSSSDGAKSITEMTALVVIFSLFINVAEKSGIISLLSDVFSSIGISSRFADLIIPTVLEVTGACSKICDGGLPLWFLSLAVGFGGLCVHLQIFDILHGVNIKKSHFFIFRIINAILSSFLTYIICIFYSPSADTFATSEFSETVFTSSSIAGTVALVIMSIVFLLSLRKTLSFDKKSVLSRNINGI